MPRNSSGTYSLPAGTTAIPDTTITSTAYNTATNDYAAALTDSLSRTGKGAMQSALPLGGFQINNVAAPTSDSDAATKGYVDGVATGVGTRLFVRVATTANITIATALNNGDTLDGVSLVTSDLVLVKNQTAAAENGIYVVGVVPARSTDFDEYDEFLGSIVAVTEGTVNANTVWLCMCNPGGTIDVTDITYTPLGSSVALPVSIENGGTGQITAAAGFDALKQNATTSYVGAVELATEAETQTGSSTTLAVTPAGGASAYEPLGKVRGINTQTDNYTLALTDAGKIVEMNKSVAVALTVPANATIAFPLNTMIDIVQYGAGQVTITAAGGVTIRSKDGNIITSGQYAGATIYKRGTDEWVLVGDLTP